ncbi:Undecaprenyl-phosphate galactose phosphotransferase WbaP/exopolysaccharide biosynthesis polyprenyl glycosylphosphotransferase [Micromonospora kangleipakensis]|uniref:Undecaprenyl-phosphate galactose phosphotransferase WbaP/exopolysaccharide biosynthesis polyprenyl glycosylphosphotransferase n=1 Tax=Micromonospora kangleipakensis TaxID=1077942 RepID=A0A4Q8B8G3_9ACTN|nr:Undecaprenyl-phosphate galactose phosphotransferase WbaP/exopolysaccharide biosynthesis polyprenyl glycosylphosphotransferase [Micromonospora kangleipakensis]
MSLHTRVPAQHSARPGAAGHHDAGVITPSNGFARSAFGRPAIPRVTWHRPYVLWLLLLDLLAALAASRTAVSLLEEADAGFRDPAAPGRVDGVFVLVANLGIPVGWLLLLAACGAYDRRALGIGTEELKRVVRADIAMAATVSLLALGFKKDLSRLTVLLVVLAALLYTLLGRFVARCVLHHLRRTGPHASQKILLVGKLSDALALYDVAVRNPGAGLRPIAIHLPHHPRPGEAVTAPVPVYVGWELVPLVQEIGADTIAVCGPASLESYELRKLAWQIEGTGLDLVVVPQVTDVTGPRIHVRPIDGLPLLTVEEPTLSGLSLVAKATLDRITALVGLILLSPVLLGIALTIKLTDPGPVMFRQTRIGHKGKAFKVWKFRTMYTDAEQRLEALKEQNESDGLLFKIRDDPRVTPIGKHLRALSLDELPQLINVLTGQMSLVGPRPLPTDDDDYQGDVRRRLLVRPGITGLWQISGRSDLSWDDAVRLDLHYVDNWSLAYDLGILWRTVSVVLARRGAY